MERIVKVLLVEADAKVITAITAFMSEIKECRLETIATLQAERLTAFQPDLLLLAAQSGSAAALADFRRMCPESYVLVSLPSGDQSVSSAMEVAGANECLEKNDHYLSNLIQAIKKALIQISARDAFDPSVHSSLNPMALDENLPDIVFTLDLAGKLLHINRAVSNLLGYEQKEMIGEFLFNFFARESSRERFLNYLKNIGCEIHFHESVEIRNSLGMEEDFNINCAFMEGDHIFGVARKHRLAEGFDRIEVLEDEADKSEDVLPPRVDRYRIVTLLGAGGMGRVYLGMDEDLERPVAIKVLSNTLASNLENLERFRQEAKILASITHPNIALIFQFGAGACPFFCMEYLPGGSLKDLLRKTGTLAPDAAASYTLQVALGLTEAQSKKVIHLDIKPSNLMLAEDQRIKIVDFGLARKNTEAGESPQDIVGTPYYVAPEQILAGIADHRSDIYSLGITLFEMLYGFVPFCGNTIKETFEQCLEKEIPSREELNPAVPPELDRIMRKMTARDPKNRYRAYSELISDLQKFLKRTSMNSGKRSLRALRPAARLWGNLYDHPFPEVLASIMRESLSGRLTVQWMDLRKEIHFHSGKITAVLSNQEGERFVDCVLQKHRITAGKARQALTESRDSYEQYLSITRDADPALLAEIVRDLQALALQILNGLFRLTLGDFIFEEGRFSEQYGMNLDAREVLMAGIKEWMDQDVVRLRTHSGKCRIELHPEFQHVLSGFPVSPADVFPLFRFERTIQFDQLQPMTGIPDQDFSRLMYLFRCLGVLDLQPLDAGVLRSKAQHVRPERIEHPSAARGAKIPREGQLSRIQHQATA